jgi:hypothetical protein
VLDSSSTSSASLCVSTAGAVSRQSTAYVRVCHVRVCAECITFVRTKMYANAYSAMYPLFARHSLARTACSGRSLKASYRASSTLSCSSSNSSNSGANNSISSSNSSKRCCHRHCQWAALPHRSSLCQELLQQQQQQAVALALLAAVRVIAFLAVCANTCWPVSVYVLRQHWRCDVSDYQLKQQCGLLEQQQFHACASTDCSCVV